MNSAKLLEIMKRLFVKMRVCRTNSDEVDEDVEMKNRQRSSRKANSTQ